MASSICVFVIDNQPLFCVGLQAVVETTTDIQWLGSAASLNQYCLQNVNFPPDVFLIASGEAPLSLMETISAGKQGQKNCKILLMLPHAYKVSLSQMTNQGINGCILKTDIPQRFIRAIRSLFEGESWLSPRLLQETLPVQIQPPTQVQLTEQEKAILQLVYAEKGNHEIATTLHMSERTVSRYLEDIYARLGVSSRVGAAIQAVKMELA